MQNAAGSPDDIPPFEIEAELARVLRDPDFRRNASATQFLRFVVQETLEGRGDRLKAFTIATSVLGRGSDFDPQANSVVRVQAKRLRELLEHYYKGAGIQNPIQIVLPVGSYQPHFQRAEPVKPAQPRPGAGARVVALQPRRLFDPRHLVFALMALVLATVLLWRDVTRLFGAPGTLRASGLPTVVVQTDPPSARPNADEQAELVAASVESALTHYDLVVVHEHAEMASWSKADYILLVRAGAPNDQRRDFVFRLLSSRSHEIVWSRAFQAIDVSGQSTADDSMVDAVAADLGELSTGAIMADMRRRFELSSPGSVQGEACVLRAADAIVRHTNELRRSLSCLAAELAVLPDDPRLLAMMSALLVAEHIDAAPGRNPASDIARARELAERAVARSPKLGTALLALFASRFFGGDVDGAFELAPQVLADQPVARLSRSLLAAAYIARGRYDEGMALGAQMQARAVQPTAFLPSYAALAAYMRGDEATARRVVFRPEASPVPLTLLLRIALCATRQDEDCAVRASEQLARSYPGVAGDIPGALDRYGLAEPFKKKLLADLRAGRPFSTREP